MLSAQHFEDALVVVAEQSLVALEAASFSISRWERQRGVLRTLINVGELGPGEQRWPQNEEYPLADYRYVTDLLRQGRSYLSSIDDDDADPASLSLLRRLEKESQLAVPVMYEGSMWGQLWATGTRGRRFGPDDVRVLEAIAAQVSVAIGRAELLQRGLAECLRRSAHAGGQSTRARRVPTRTRGPRRHPDAAGLRSGRPEGGQRPRRPSRRRRAVARRGGCAERRRLRVPGVAGRTVGR